MGLTKISNVTFVEASGYDSLILSWIISDSARNTSELTVEINGTNTIDFDIYCNSTDTCTVKCQSAQACTNLNLHCSSNCYVQCNPDIGM